MSKESVFMKKKRKFHFTTGPYDQYVDLYNSEVIKIINNLKLIAEAHKQGVSLTSLDNKKIIVEFFLLATDQEYKVLIEEITKTLGLEIKEEKTND